MHVFRNVENRSVMQKALLTTRLNLGEKINKQPTFDNFILTKSELYISSSTEYFFNAMKSADIKIASEIIENLKNE